MSKAVMLSIRPKWVEKIANGEKTIEVRKTKPKLEAPFKCYIYCTLPKYPHEDFIATDYPRPQFYGGGKVIGEFTCDRIYKIDKDSTDFLFKAGGLSVYKQAAEEKCGLCVAMTDDELHGYESEEEDTDARIKLKAITLPILRQHKAESRSENKQ